MRFAGCKMGRRFTDRRRDESRRGRPGGPRHTRKGIDVLGQRPPQFYLDTKEQPYTTLRNQPFDLVRVWGRGGKTNVWGRVSLRYSDVDFTNPDRDGWEIPWPIRYKDIAPYYDQVDQVDRRLRRRRRSGFSSRQPFPSTAACAAMR
jgi:choline dehydrogenase-like flavoprotein